MGFFLTRLDEELEASDDATDAVLASELVASDLRYSDGDAVGVAYHGDCGV